MSEEPGDVVETDHGAGLLVATDRRTFQRQLSGTGPGEQPANLAGRATPFEWNGNERGRPAACGGDAVLQYELAPPNRSRLLMGGHQMCSRAMCGTTDRSGSDSPMPSA